MGVRPTYSCEITYDFRHGGDKCPSLNLSEENNSSGVRVQGTCRPCFYKLIKRVDQVGIFFLNRVIALINKFGCCRGCICSRTSSDDNSVSSKTLWLIHISGVMVILGILAGSYGLWQSFKPSDSLGDADSPVAITPSDDTSNPSDSPTPTALSSSSDNSISTTPFGSSENLILKCERCLSKLIFLKCNSDPVFYDTNGTDAEKWDSIGKRMDGCFTKPAQEYLANIVESIRTIAEVKTQDFCAKAKRRFFCLFSECTSLNINLEEMHSLNRALQNIYLENESCLNVTSTFKV